MALLFFSLYISVSDGVSGENLLRKASGGIIEENPDYKKIQQDHREEESLTAFHWFSDFSTVKENQSWPKLKSVQNIQN